MGPTSQPASGNAFEDPENPSGPIAWRFRPGGSGRQPNPPFPTSLEVRTINLASSGRSMKMRAEGVSEERMKLLPSL